MPRLDIFVLSYNRADYIAETLDSLFAQTFRDFRVVILDNASTDGTADVVKAYDVEFLPVAENIGVYENFRRVRELATSEWVMAFHDDDLLHPRYLERAFEQIDASEDCFLVGGNYEGIVDPTLEALSARDLDAACWRFKNAAHFASFCFTKNDVAFASCLYRREAVERLKPEAEFCPEIGKMWDRPAMIELCKGGSAVVLRGIYVDYRLHAGQDTQTPTSGPFRAQAIALTKYYKSVMGADWSTSWGKSFIINNRGYLRGLHKWVSDRKDRTFGQFVRDAYRDGAATKAVFIPRPIIRRLKKHYLRRDPDFY